MATGIDDAALTIPSQIPEDSAGRGAYSERHGFPR
jgi:hypothetical protein